MKKIRSFLSAIRILSMVLPAAMLLLYYFTDIRGSITVQDMFWSAYFASGVLLTGYGGGERATLSLAAAAAQCACGIVMPLAAAGPHCCALCGAAVPFAHFIYLCRKRFKPAGAMSYSAIVRFCIESTSSSFYMVVLLLSALTFLPADTASANALCRIAALILECALFAILYVRAYTGRSLFVSGSFERRMDELSKGASRMATPQNISDSNSTVMYRRLTGLMDTEKPYLDADLNLEKVTRMLFTNKTYLSRTIHDCSGRNFCQFVNWYRIQYALELMKKDPHLKVREVASMSGFNSVVTFEVSFQYFTGKKPSEYLTVNLRK